MRESETDGVPWWNFCNGNWSELNITYSGCVRNIGAIKTICCLSNRPDKRKDLNRPIMILPPSLRHRKDGGLRDGGSEIPVSASACALFSCAQCQGSSVECGITWIRENRRNSLRHTVRCLEMCQQAEKWNKRLQKLANIGRSQPSWSHIERYQQHCQRQGGVCRRFPV